MREEETREGEKMRRDKKTDKKKRRGDIVSRGDKRTDEKDRRGDKRNREAETRRKDRREGE